MLPSPRCPATAHEGRCDGSGRFRIELPRTSSARHDAADRHRAGAGLRHRLGRARPRRRSARRRRRPAARADHPRAALRRAGPAGAGAWRCGSSRSIPSCAGDLDTRSSGPTSHERPWRDLPAWPGPAISDDEGRFTLRGLGRRPISAPRSTTRDSPPPASILTADDADARPLDARIRERSRSSPARTRSRSRSPCSRPGRSSAA